METAMSHIVYFHFHLIAKSFLSFLLTWSVCASKTWEEKIIVPNIFSSQNFKQLLGDLFGSKNTKRGKIDLNPAFNKKKINDLGPFEKSQQSYLSETGGEAISAIPNTVIHDAENFGLLPIYEAKTGKE